VLATRAALEPKGREGCRSREVHAAAGEVRELWRERDRVPHPDACSRIPRPRPTHSVSHPRPHQAPRCRPEVAEGAAAARHESCSRDRLDRRALPVGPRQLRRAEDANRGRCSAST
jgi:hypothetical protein